VDVARGKPLLTCMDVNAVSGAWFSKYVNRSRMSEGK